MLNQHFRMALAMSVDRGTYNAQSVGEDLKFNALANSYTPGNFQFLAEEVTVSINGTDKTFAAGTYYGEIMQAQIDADGFKVKVWDPTLEGGLGSSDTFDGWYNVENAVAELDIAIAALAEDGIEISAKNPIELDLPVPTGSPVYNARGQVYKQSIEDALGGKVIVNIVACDSYDEWYSTGYYTESGAQANYDMYDLSGWGPDYGDPQTYLDTFLPDYNGYMVKCIGIF
jgi:peptide/nickel transport system substrate-binding protein/oligopeptide transport system substrate-binding protein